MTKKCDIKQEPKQETPSIKKEPCFYPHELMKADDFYKYRYLVAVLNKNKKYTRAEAIQAIEERKK